MPASPHRVWQAIQVGQAAAERKESAHVQHSNTSKPDSVADAAALLAQDGGKALAGGQSLVAAMKLRLAQPGTLVDLSGIAELKGIRKEGDALVIGAMTRHAEVAASKDVQARDSGARRAGRGHRRPPGAQHGHDRRLARQQRSGRATIRRRCSAWTRRSHTNKRKIAADEFFKGMYETALAATRSSPR